MKDDWEEESSLNRVLFQATRLYFARCFHVFERLDVHPGQMPVLFEVHRSGGLYQRELCRNLCLRPSTMTVTLQRMEKAGLIERRQDSRDQRLYRIFLTPKGEKTVEELRRALHEIESASFAGFTTEELLLLRRFAVQVRDNLAGQMQEGAAELPKKEGNSCSSF